MILVLIRLRFDKSVELSREAGLGDWREDIHHYAALIFVPLFTSFAAHIMEFAISCCPSSYAVRQI